MNQLDEQKALQILDLNPDATKEDIFKRYGVVSRKFRTIEKDENGYTFEEVTRAYNLLMGITFKDEEEEKRQKALRENPPFLARILKKDPIKLENFFHYYRVHMLVALGVILLMFFTIRSCVNQVNPDFNLILYGNVYLEETQPLEADIREKLPEIVAPTVQNYGGGGDPQYEYAMQMKMMAMLSAQEIDLLLMDSQGFQRMAGQGVLLPLEGYMDILGFPADRFVRGTEILEQPMDGDPVYGSEKIYGIDITDSDYAREYNILGEKLIIAAVVNSTKLEEAISYLQQIN